MVADICVIVPGRVRLAAWIATATDMKLVNNHEKLREEVADTLGDLDALIEELEGADKS